MTKRRKILLGILLFSLIRARFLGFSKHNLMVVKKAIFVLIDIVNHVAPSYLK